jgi:hypothetical protein
MMNVPVIGFIPPHIGLEEEFNTFRLGLALAKRLEPGVTVFLMDTKAQTVFGTAKVVSIGTGSLAAMCLKHGARNHSELGFADPGSSPARLFELMQKIYGPHIATETKKTTVVYLRRNHEFRTTQHHAVREEQGQNG